MRTISEIAGGILLYLYWETRDDPLNMDFKGFRFRYNEKEWVDKQKFDEFQANLLTAAGDNQKDLRNAILYLTDEGFITYTKDNDNTQEGYRNFKITSAAVKLIEGVERKENSSKKQFVLTFNFRLESLLKIDSLLKNKFGLINL